MAELEMTNTQSIKLEPFFSKWVILIISIVLTIGLSFLGTLGLLLAGIFTGFLIRDGKDGALYSYIGGVIGITISVFIFFLMGFSILGLPPEYNALFAALIIIVAPIAGLIAGIIVAIGGLLGGLIASAMYKK